MLSFKDKVIAHDRRGHGRSTQISTGHDMDTYASDVAELTAALDLKDAIQHWSLNCRWRNDPFIPVLVLHGEEGFFD